MRTILRDDGRPVSIGPLLGKGGEGSVYEVFDESQVVAKLYHREIDRAKADKLEAMVQVRTERLLNLAAWPIAALYSRRGGLPIGLLMRRVIGYKEAHHLYSPKSRKIEFDNADWRFLIHASTNLARAVAVIHEHGHVIGDVNHGNFLINSQAMAALIDCDSFQVAISGKRFLCEVGVPTYTPPELQSRPFNGVVRTANHDNFGLAVLIFHHLFMGRHPFAGRFLGPGEMSLERAIAEFRFAFSRRAKSLAMSPPPNTLALGAASEPVATLFERAFGPGSDKPNARPRAAEWIDALNVLSKRLRRCTTNTAHYFYSSLSKCPWCEIEGVTGAVLFSVFVLNPSGTTVDIVLIWRQIEAVAPPGPRPPVSPPVVNVSDSARRYRRKRRARVFLAWGVVVLAMIIIFSASLADVTAFWVFVGSCVLATGIVRAAPKEDKSAIRQRLGTATERFRKVDAHWRSKTGEESFTSLREELDAKYREHNSLSALRQRKYQGLAGNIRQAQLNRYLESQYIEYANITKIGPGRKAILASFGIETAADITVSALTGISGFGPTYNGNLLAWRRSVERSFVFDPSSGVDSKDVQALDNEIARNRAELETALINGRQRLETVKEQILAARRSLLPEYENAWREKVQLEVDLAGM